MTKSKRENLCFSVAVSVAVEIAAYFLLALVLSYFAAGRSDPASMVGIAAYATVFLTFRSEEHTSELQSLRRISYAVERDMHRFHCAVSGCSRLPAMLKGRGAFAAF